MFDVSYNEKPFSDFGIVKAICKNGYTMPNPNIETTHISGRNGDLHFNYGDFQNVSLTYLCLINDDFKASYLSFCEWIMSKRGYQRLEDDLYPDYFRMAAVTSPPSLGSVHNSFEITFSCKPQRFLKSGENSTDFSTSGTIYNPTQTDSFPLIRVIGTGELKIAEETITITENPDYIDIDCDLQDAFHETENRNSKIELSSGDFPVLHSGSNGVELASGMTVTVTPRWYVL